MSATDSPPISASTQEQLCRAAGTVVFRRPDPKRSGARRDWVRAFAGVDPNAPGAKMRGWLELQAQSALENQFPAVEMAGASLDFLTTPDNPPAWIGDHDHAEGNVSLRYHGSAPAVVLSIGADLNLDLRRWLEDEDDQPSPTNVEYAFYDIIEPIICNSALERIPPHKAGLTSNPFILSDEVDRTGRGELRNLGRLIYFEPYQTRCPVEALAESGRIRLSIKA